MNNNFTGAKGGSSNSFKSLPDTLRSDDSFELLLGLGSGRWKGPVDGLKSFKINGVPLENADGSTNFQEFAVFFADGDPAQTQRVNFKLGGGGGTSQVNTTIGNSNTSGPGPWVTAAVTTPNADFIDIRLVIQSLFQQDKNGIRAAQATLELEMRPSGALNWINPFLSNVAPTYDSDGISIDDGYGGEILTYLPKESWNSNGNAWNDASPGYIRINEKTTSAAVKELRIAVPKSGAYANKTWQVRVRLIEPSVVQVPDSTDETRRAIQFESITAVSQAVLGESEAWRGLVWVQVVGKATDQISGVPSIEILCNTKIVKTPPINIFNPDTRQYTGAIWDGSYTLNYTNDPAWCIKDLIEDPISGIAALSPGATLDRWDALEASKYFSQLVPDGNGGMHPRFSMNYTIDQAQNTEELIQYIGGAVNALVMDTGDGKWRMKVDKPETPTATFTRDNIIGEFTYNHTDVDTRYNDYTVSFNNREQDYIEDRVRVYDQAHIDLFGRKPTTIVALGANNRQEALRRAMIRLRVSTKETTMVNFTTNRQGLMVSPLDVILVADTDLGYVGDPTASGNRTTTRLESRSGTTLNLGSSIRLETGVAYQVHLTVPNPDYDPNSTDQPISADWRKPTITISRNVVNTSLQRGDVSVLYVDSALPDDTPENAPVALSAVGLPSLPVQYRVMDVTPQEDDVVNISALIIDTGKWAAADNVTEADIFAQVSNTTVPSPTVPADGMFHELFFDTDFMRKRVLSITWDRPASLFLEGYRVEHNINDGPWIIDSELTKNTYLELQEPTVGKYTVRITAIDRKGRPSVPLTGSYDLEDKPLTADDIPLYDPTGEGSPNKTETVNDVVALPNILGTKEKQTTFKDREKTLMDRHANLVSLVNDDMTDASDAIAFALLEVEQMKSEYVAWRDNLNPAYNDFTKPTEFSRTTYLGHLANWSAALDALDSLVKVGAPVGTEIGGVPVEDLVSELNPNYVSIKDKTTTLIPRVTSLITRGQILVDYINSLNLPSSDPRVAAAEAVSAAITQLQTFLTSIGPITWDDISGSSLINNTELNSKLSTLELAIDNLNRLIGFGAPSGTDIGGRPVDEVITDLDDLKNLGADYADFKPDLEKLTKQYGRDIDTLSKALSNALLGLNRTQENITDAGIIVDASSGKAQLYGVQVTEEQIKKVQLQLDAAEGRINSKASVSYVNEAILQAQLPGGSLDLSALLLRLSDAEVDIDALKGEITSKVSVTEFTGLKGTVTNVEQRLDAAEAEIVNRVEQTTFTELDTRVSSVEEILDASGDTVGLIQEVKQARYLSDLDGKSLINSMLEGHKGRKDILVQVATARNELTTKINDDLSTEAAARQQVYALTLNVQAGLATEVKARTDQNQATTQRIQDAESKINDPNTGLAKAHSRITTTENTMADNEAATAQSLQIIQSTINDPVTGLPKAHARITTEVGTVATNLSAEITARQSLSGVVNNPTTGLPATVGRVDTISNVVLTPTTGLVSKTESLSTAVFDQTTGLAQAYGKADNAVKILVSGTPETGSALLTRTSSLEGAVNHPTTGLQQAYGKASDSYSILTTGTPTTGSAIVSRTSSLEGAVNHPTTGLQQAYGKASDSYSILTTGTPTTGSAIVSRTSNLEGAVNHPTTGLQQAYGKAKDAVEILTTGTPTTGSAIVSRTSNLEGAVNHPTTGLQQAYGKAKDAVEILTTGTPTTGSAIVSRTSELEGSVNNPSTGLTAVRNKANAVTTLVGDNTSGLIKQTNDLSTEVFDNTTSGLPYVRARANALTTIVGDSSYGLVKQTNDLSVNVGNINGTLSTYSTVAANANQAVLKYGVRLDSNGYVTGFEQNNNGVTSDFYVRADKFIVGLPGYSALQVFTVDSTGVQINGNMQINGNAIITGTINGSKISNGAVTPGKIDTPSLGAISANIGSLVSYNGAGGRVERDGNGTRVYDNNGVLRVKIGF